VITSASSLTPSLTPSLGDPVTMYNNLINGTSIVYNDYANGLPKNISTIAKIAVDKIISNYKISPERICAVNIKSISNPTPTSLFELSFIITDNKSPNPLPNDYLSHKCIGDWIIRDFNSEPSSSPLVFENIGKNGVFPTSLQSPSCPATKPNIVENYSEEDYSGTNTQIANAAVYNPKPPSVTSTPGVSSSSYNTTYIIIAIVVLLILIIGIFYFMNRNSKGKNKQKNYSGGLFDIGE